MRLDQEGHSDIELDRKVEVDVTPEQRFFLPKGFFGDDRYRVLMEVMADLDSNCVVVLGNDRVDDALARKLLNRR